MTVAMSNTAYVVTMQQYLMVLYGIYESPVRYYLNVQARVNFTGVIQDDDWWK